MLDRVHKGYQKLTAGETEAKKFKEACLRTLADDRAKLTKRIDELTNGLAKNQSLDERFRGLLAEIGAPEHLARHRGLVGDLHLDLRRLADTLATSNGDAPDHVAKLLNGHMTSGHSG